MTNSMSHNDDVIRCQITDSEEIDDSQNAVSTLLENFELPDIGNVKEEFNKYEVWGRIDSNWCEIYGWSYWNKNVFDSGTPLLLVNSNWLKYLVDVEVKKS